MLVKRDFKILSSAIVIILLAVTLLILTLKPQPQPLQGYIESRLAYIGSPAPGTLSQLMVKRGDIIKKGQPLFQLDQESEQASYSEAKAAEDRAIAEKMEAEENLKFALHLLARRKELHGQHVLTAEALETVENDYQKAQKVLTAKEAMVQQAKALFKKASWAKVQKAVYAQESGMVFDTYYLPSEFVSPERPVVSLLFPGQTHVIFYLNEPQLHQITHHQEIQFSVDGKQLNRARITYISPRPEFTPPIIYSEKLRRSNLVYRVEAIPLIASSTLHAGQPVSIFL